MIRFSKREDYAVILADSLARAYGKRLVPLSEIAATYKISLLFLRNLAYELRQHEIIKAVEGKKGGYYLSKDPASLKVGEILEVFNTKPMLQCCSFGDGRTKCPKEQFCQPGHVWTKLNKEFLDKIYNLTLLEFMKYKNE